jgi:hypothetical protein
MTYTVTNLVNNAYYLANIVSRGYETVSGGELADGVEYLNDLLADKTVDDGMIPYKSTGTFSGVIGQEAYPIADLISVDTLTFTIDDVRYPMTDIQRNAYFGSGRVNNIDSLPYSYHVERDLGGATIYMYFSPDNTYTFEWWGTSRLASVTAAQDLELTLDRFYINMLKYELAERLCGEFGFEVPSQVVEQNKRYRRMINKKSAP